MGYTHDACPHCGFNLVGEAIPEEARQWYSGTHFRHEIGVCVQGVYDGVLYYQCPECQGAWHRWPDGYRQRTQAEPHIKEANQNRRIS